MNIYEDLLWLVSSVIWFIFIMIWWYEKKDFFSDHNEMRYTRRLYRLVAVLPLFVNIVVLLLKVGLFIGFIR